MRPSLYLVFLSPLLIYPQAILPQNCATDRLHLYLCLLSKVYAVDQLQIGVVCQQCGLPTVWFANSVVQMIFINCGR